MNQESHKQLLREPPWPRCAPGPSKNVNERDARVHTRAADRAECNGERTRVQTSNTATVAHLTLTIRGGGVVHTF